MRKILWTGTLALALAAPLAAKIEFIKGPAKASLGDQAEIQVPDGWSFVPQGSMKDFDAATQNLYSPDELGCLLSPEGGDGQFWAFFQFEDIGYIKDAASEKLDADAMWTEMKDNEDDVNAARRKQGYPESTLGAWTIKPNYNAATQRLEWAYTFSSRGKETVNFNTRILGRKGVMRVTVVPFGSLDDSLPLFNETIAGFEYKDGNRYAQFSSGDKLAKAGLAALIVGGAAAAAGSGLLAKLWKVIVLAFVAAASAIKKFFNRLLGRKEAGAPAPAADGASKPGLGFERREWKGADPKDPPPDIAPQPDAPPRPLSQAQPQFPDDKDGAA